MKTGITILNKLAFKRHYKNILIFQNCKKYVLITLQFLFGKKKILKANLQLFLMDSQNFTKNNFFETIFLNSEHS